VGKLTRHPTTKFEGESQQGTTFTLAVQEPSWGRAAETCSLLNAEDLIAVQGKLAWQQRTGKCGQEHSLLVVNVRDVAVLDAAAVEVSA
jgi:single-stranded DNA-binding protein